MKEIIDEIPETELPGERVVLRVLHEPDAAGLYRLIDASREHLSRFLPWPPDCNSVERPLSVTGLGRTLQVAASRRRR